ncbi:MAG: cytochrome c maturation protein CcmE domain-containing protein [Candidatus Hodarchaeales archaeon]|jgi:cytochrome c-type biogenesis protein CcmE
MANTKNIILAGAVIAVCVGALFILFVGSSVPIYSVKELMDDPKAESFIDRRIQIVGNVTEINSTHFTIIDPEEVNTSLKIYVVAVNVERPTGFELDRTVVVEGKLLSITNIWTFKASMISTKCPSKYQ